MLNKNKYTSIEIIDEKVNSLIAKSRIIYLLIIISLFIISFLIENKAIFLILFISAILLSFYAYLKYVLNNFYTKVGMLYISNDELYFDTQKIERTSIKELFFYYNTYAGAFETMDDGSIIRLYLRDFQSRGMRNYIFIEYISGKKELIHILLKNKKQYLAVKKYFDSNYPESVKKTPTPYTELLELLN